MEKRKQFNRGQYFSYAYSTFLGQLGEILP
uniref:Uncharacterized protein n=1 Tax=Rhizophora mucronata TaxID=61149 RepID=A0A2P2Q288_RHIMU